MAKYKKSRVRELKHDRFRDETMKILNRAGDKLEGKGKTILYGLAALVLVAVLVGVWTTWSNRKHNEARRALGRAITISNTPVAAGPSLDPTTPTFATERERAQRAAEEFDKVAAKYSDPYRAEARYFAGTNRLSFDRNRGVQELSDLSKSDSSDVGTLAKFALAQAKEADSSFDEAAQLYSDIAKQKTQIVTPEVANLRLALVNDKQGKKKEAADLLFEIVETARKAKDAEGLPVPQSAVARNAAEQLEKIDSARYAQLTPEAPRSDMPF